MIVRRRFESKPEPFPLRGLPHDHWAVTDACDPKRIQFNFPEQWWCVHCGIKMNIAHPDPLAVL